MAIVTKPEGDKVTLYDIPDDQLEQFKVAPDKAAQMFPESGGAASASDAMGVIKSGGVEGDVQAYANSNICWVLRCNAYGYCWYVYWYC